LLLGVIIGLPPNCVFIISVTEGKSQTEAAEHSVRIDPLGTTCARGVCHTRWLVGM